MGHPRWTPQDLAYLRGALPDHTLQYVAERLGRTPHSVWKRASKIGLLREMRQGMETVKQASERLGLCEETTRRIAANASLVPVLTKYHRASERRQRLFDRDTIEHAAVAWMAYETATEAAARLGVRRATLCICLRKLGKKLRSNQRLPPEKFDAAWREWPRVKAMARGSLAPKGYERLSEAALRVGMCYEALRNELIRSGVKIDNRGCMLRTEEVDRIVAEYRRREPMSLAAPRLGIPIAQMRRALDGSGRAWRSPDGAPLWHAPEFYDEVLAEYRARLATTESPREASKRLGCTSEVVVRALRGAGLTPCGVRRFQRDIIDNAVRVYLASQESTDNKEAAT